MKVFLLTTGERDLKFFNILYLSIEMGIAYESLFSIDRILRTQLCQTFSQKPHHSSTVDRIDEHRYVKFHIPVDQGGEPIAFEHIRISIGEYRTNKRIPNLKLGRVNSHHRRGNHILHIGKCLHIVFFSFLQEHSLFFRELSFWIIQIDSCNFLGKIFVWQRCRYCGSIFFNFFEHKRRTWGFESFDISSIIFFYEFCERGNWHECSVLTIVGGREWCHTSILLRFR